MACPMRQELSVTDFIKIAAGNTCTDTATVAVAVAIQTILFLAYLKQKWRKKETTLSIG